MIRIVAGELLYDWEDLIAAGAATFTIPSPSAPRAPVEVDFYPSPSGWPVCHRCADPLYFGTDWLCAACAGEPTWANFHGIPGDD